MKATVNLILAILIIVAIFIVARQLPQRAETLSDYEIVKIAARTKPNLQLFIETVSRRDEVDPALAVAQHACAFLQIVKSGEYDTCMEHVECFTPELTKEGYAFSNAYNSCENVSPQHLKGIGRARNFR